MRPPTLEPGLAVSEHSATQQQLAEGRAAPGPLSSAAQQYAGVRAAILHGIDAAGEDEEAGAAAAWPPGPEQPAAKRLKREASPSGAAARLLLSTSELAPLQWVLSFCPGCFMQRVEV